MGRPEFNHPPRRSCRQIGMGPETVSCAPCFLKAHNFLASILPWLYAYAICHGKLFRLGKVTLQELRKRIYRSLLCGWPMRCFSG